MHRYQAVALLLLSLVFIALACSEPPQGGKTSGQENVKTPDKEDMKTIEKEEAKTSGKEEVSIPHQDNKTTPVKADKDDIKTLVQGNNEFAFDLYQRLSQEKGNVVFSPFSVSNALAMIYGGAGGDTAKEMAKSLHFTLPPERLHPAFAALAADLLKDSTRRGYDLHLANALWGQKGYSFQDAFLRLTRQNYRAGFRELDFRNPEAARRTINRWVAEQTQDRITELLDKGELNGQTRLVQTSALYFKASWAIPFPKENTKDADFSVTPTEKVTVPMMCSSTGVYKFVDCDDFQVVELPYLGERLALVVLLPKKGDLPGLEESLTAEKLQRAFRQFSPHIGQVTLPRFKVSTHHSLAEHLQAIGMRRAFSGAADFSGMSPGLHMAFVEHQAYIDVDEAGTEAAGASAANMAASIPVPFSFCADHPFLFLIREQRTGSILFLGRLTQPSR